MSMDYKAITLRAYEKHAREYDKKFRKHFEESVIPMAARFLALLPLPGARVLDVGAASGYHAVWFRERGCDVVCIDNCEKMIAFCRNKGLEAQLMDFEALDFSPESFDGVWAYASLLHAPKAHLSRILERIAVILKPRGAFGLAVKEGTEERFVSYPHDAGSQRFFADYAPREVEQALEPWFEIMYADTKTTPGKDPFLKWVAKRKNRNA